MYGVAGDYQKTANDEILVIPMIETRKAVENIDEILDVPGIDAIYVGPADLAFSLGKTPKLDSEDTGHRGLLPAGLILPSSSMPFGFAV
jgi:4-hydroxy-2-oxoheptanedioate aldolase